MEWLDDNRKSGAFEKYGDTVVESKTAMEWSTSPFVAVDGKFIGGFDTPSIADYVCGVKFHCVNHPAIKAKVGYEVPMRFKRYVEDWQKALSPESQKFLEAGKGFLDTKL